MSDEGKKFKKIDVEKLRIQQQAASADVDRALRDLSEDIQKKKQMKL